MVVKFEDIEWDADEAVRSGEGLPPEHLMEVEDAGRCDGELVDMLEDEFGWLIKGCVVRRFEEVEHE